MKSNPHFAKTKLDRVCLFIFVFGVHLALWYEVCLVMASYDFQDTSTMKIHLTMAAIFYFSVLSNLYKLVTTRTDCNLGVIGSNETREWPYCDRCCIYKPPRSHHCKRCDVCVLLRDHHCWFSGCCVGYTNYRYYMSLLFFMFSAAIYANVFHYRFVMDELGHLEELLPFCILAPHLGLLLGFMSRYHLFVSMMTSLALFCMVMFAWLWTIQIYQLIKGQTKYELKHKITDYHHGIVSNLSLIMGRRWYVAWIFPWIPSPPPGNGTEFPEHRKKK